MTVTIRKITTPREDFKIPVYDEIPNMYLELIENKEKVNQNILNTPYTPSPIPNPISEHLDTLMEKSNASTQPYQASSRGSSPTSDLADGFDTDSGTGSYARSASSGSAAQPLETSKEEQDTIVNAFSGNERHAPKPRIQNPPTLEQLNIQTHATPDLSRVNTQSDTELNELKRKILLRFDILREKDPEIDLPHYTMNSDYESMKSTYEATLRKGSLKQNVEFLRELLNMFFMATEYGLGKYLKMDMKGYTDFQKSRMSSYNAMLYELGERSYLNDVGMGVELRLICALLLNTATFIGMKYMLPGLSSLTTPKAPLKRHMKRPTVNTDGIHTL